jgi:hypothetical protein
MYRVCIEKATGKLIEMQSGEAELGVLTQNAVNAGYSEADIEEKIVTAEEYAVILEAQKPVPTLDDIKKAKYYEITAAYQAELNGTFISSATGAALVYDYGPESQARWKKLLDAIVAGFTPDTLFPMPITTASGVMVPHTKEQLLQLGSEITIRELQLYGRWQQMVVEGGTIRQATTPEDVAAITW